MLSKSGIKELLKFGISFNESHCDFLLDYLIKSDSEAKIEYVFSRLGWGNVLDNRIFKLYQAICENNIPKFSSKYIGNLSITPKGNVETWLNLIKEFVLPYTPLTFCMLLGFAAPILSSLYQKYDLGSLIFSISNDSSKGKSTSAALAASVFSNPILGQGTVQNFCCTQNYLMTFLCESSGLPVVLDEGATYKGDFNQLFYTISSGKDKGRLTKDAVMKDPINWNNIVITTAEFNPIDDNSPNGIRTRCFCITDNLTINANQADKIKKTISENYGKVGIEFIKWLLNSNQINIESNYLASIKILFKALKNENAKEGHFTSRVFSRLSIILLTATYVKSCFSIDINIEKLIEYIISIERKINNETDLIQKAMDIILSEVSQTSAHYISIDNLNPNNVCGKVGENENIKVVTMLKSEFNRICAKYNLHGHLILQKLKGRNILVSESDRLSKRVRLQKNFPEQVCYIFKISDPESIPNKYDSQILF